MAAESFPDTPAYNALLARIHEIHDLEKAAAVLSWDREVNMPRAGLTGRIHQMIIGLDYFIIFVALIHLIFREPFMQMRGDFELAGCQPLID